MPSDEHNSPAVLAERKRMLVAQGASYRSGISHARAAVHSSLSAESLTKSALSHVAMGALNAFKGGGILKGVNLQVLLPVAMSLYSRLSNKSHFVKPIVRGVLVLGAAAAIARFVIKKKNANKVKKRRLEAQAK